MEKVYFQNQNANLSVSIYSGKEMLLTILPGFEDWIEFPVGKSEIIVSSKLLGVSFKKERHWIDVGAGISNVQIQLDPMLDKNFPIELPFLLFLALSGFVNSFDLKTEDFNFAYFKVNSEQLLNLINAILFCLIIPVYVHLIVKCYRRIKKLKSIFVVNYIPSNL